MSASAFLSKAATSAAAKQAFQRLLNSGSRLLTRARARCDLDELGDSLYSVRYTKTIWQPERPVSIRDFYCPTRVELSHLDESRTVSVRRISDFEYNGNVIVRGTAGQGKSTFLRYLAVMESSREMYLPLFIELRRISSRMPFDALIVKTLERHGIPMNYETFVEVAASGGVLLLLDAFDEVPKLEQSETLEAIEALSRAGVRIVLSTRPGPSVVHSPHFANVDICSLSPRAVHTMIRKMMRDADDAESLILGIQQRDSVVHMLQTPLMVTLLIIHYEVERDIPRSELGFYEGLFMLLFRRHDNFKPGYVREYECTLDIAEIFDVFCFFCLLTLCRDLNSLSEVELYAHFEQAISIVCVSAPAPAVARDIASITSLIIREGQAFSFVHKTVQEYHAARTVAKQNEAFKASFYTQARTKEIGCSRQTLYFLSKIDKYAFIEHFAVPILEQVEQESMQLGGLLASVNISVQGGRCEAARLTGVASAYSKLMGILGERDLLLELHSIAWPREGEFHATRQRELPDEVLCLLGRIGKQVGSLRLSFAEMLEAIEARVVLLGLLTPGATGQ